MSHFRHANTKLKPTFWHFYDCARTLDTFATRHLCLCACIIPSGDKTGVAFVCPVSCSHPQSSSRDERELQQEGEEEIVVREEGGAFHRHAKTFQGKPSQIFPTVCGESFASPVTHTYTYTHRVWESAKSECTSVHSWHTRSFCGVCYFSFLLLTPFLLSIAEMYFLMSFSVVQHHIWQTKNSRTQHRVP